MVDFEAKRIQCGHELIFAQLSTSIFIKFFEIRHERNRVLIDKFDQSVEDQLIGPVVRVNGLQFVLYNLYLQAQIEFIFPEILNQLILDIHLSLYTLEPAYFQPQLGFLEGGTGSLIIECFHLGE